MKLPPCTIDISLGGSRLTVQVALFVDAQGGIAFDVDAVRRAVDELVDCAGCVKARRSDGAHVCSIHWRHV